MYNIGMYGGSFEPLHNGHASVIQKAASVCHELYLVLSYSRNRDTIPMEYRYRWLALLTEEMKNVKIILLEDFVESKVAYDTDEQWEYGAKIIREKIGKKIDVVFCGTDYLANKRYEKLYPESEIIYVDRNIIPISSSEIRTNPIRYWDMIPKIAKSYFVKKVLIVGGESTGKSTLTKLLAQHYETNYIAEAGREVCYQAGGEDYMVAEDLYKCLLYQKCDEYRAVENSNRLLFVDTDALTTKFFVKFLIESSRDEGKCNNLADAIADINRFDLIFFLEPNVPFVQDGTRNNKLLEDRKGYSDQLKDLYDQQNMKYICLDGDYAERFEEAKKHIDKLINDGI